MKWQLLYLEFPETGRGAGLDSEVEQMVRWLTLSVHYVPHLKTPHNQVTQGDEVEQLFP